MIPHAQTWAQQKRKLYPVPPLHRGREYHDAASHSNAELFRQRQIARGLKPCQR